LTVDIKKGAISPFFFYLAINKYIGFKFMRSLLLLPLLLGLVSPAIAHNEANTKCPEGEELECLTDSKKSCFCMEKFI
tara:strand:- start:44 stop:277 length:234 start_codon:yes stop_codon:yes gene_type:complete